MNPAMKTKAHNLVFWSVTIFILLVTLIIAWRSSSPEPVPDTAKSLARISPTTMSIPAADLPVRQAASGALSAAPTPTSSSNAAIDPVAYSDAGPETVNAERVKEMVQELEFDEYGHLIISTDARRQLDHAIDLIGFQRNSAEFAQLNEAIHSALPGEAGKQVTDLLGLYYEYKLVEMDFAQSRDAASPADAANHYKMLSDMRQSYLGDTLTKKLFAEEDRFMNYTHELMQLESRAALSAQQRAAAEQQLKMKYFPAESE